MTLSEISQGIAEFYQRNQRRPNAILLDFYGDTQLSQIMQSVATIKSARQPGARAKEIAGLKIVQADVDGFIICLI